MKTVAVFLAGLIGIATVLILDATAARFRIVTPAVLLIIAGVIGLHGIRFLIWAWLHKNYSISQTYPLSAVFFPIIFVVSWFQGDVDLSWSKVCGLTLIVIGLIVSEVRSLRTKN